MLSRKGFTLLELIIVIAILTILATLLLPMSMNFIKRANEAADLANANLIYTASAIQVATTAGDIDQTYQANADGSSPAFYKEFIGDPWPHPKLSGTASFEVAIQKIGITLPSIKIYRIDGSERQLYVRDQNCFQ